MKHIGPLTLVLGVAPFAAASLAIAGMDHRPLPIEPTHILVSQVTPSPPPDFLKALVRLLAKQAAQEAFAAHTTNQDEKESDDGVA